MEKDYSFRNFMILSTSELPSVDFNQVLETSADTVRKSIDLTKTFVKWKGDQVPSSVEALSTKEGPYTYEEITSILSTDEWSQPYDPPPIQVNNVNTEGIF